ncbi:MAG: DUF91 domain-containing protein [Fibrobacteres bacterium]|nr:DUF91 domain-containing protein [Fibrobacterota bacterium]
MIAFPEIGLELEQAAEGVVVRQFGDAYVARNWRLTDDVIAKIKICLGSGLKAMIQVRHPEYANRMPKGDGVIYFSFARSEKEMWIVVFNDNSPFPKKRPFDNVSTVLINKRFRHFLTAGDIPWVTEKGRSACNVEIPCEFLETAIASCLKGMEGDFQKNLSILGDQKGGFRGESDIEKWLMENLEDRSGGQLEIIGRQVRLENGIIDILAIDKDSDQVLIIEVKQQRAVSSVVEEQIPRYLASQRVMGICKNRRAIGVLVAEEIPESIRRLIREHSLPLRGYEIKWSQNGVSFFEVCSSSSVFA